MLVGLALAAVGAGLVASSRGRRRRFDPDASWGTEQFHDATEFDAAPVVEIRSAFGEVRVVAGDGPGIGVRSIDVEGAGHAVRGRRSDDERGDVLRLDVHPRSSVEVTVPHGTAVRMLSAKTSIVLTGIDDVDVRSAKGTIAMRDVAGTVRVRSASEMVDLRLSRERETRSVDVEIAKALFSLAVPAARGGAYRILTAKSRVNVPPSVEGGIPIRIRGARAEIAVRAA